MDILIPCLILLRLAMRIQGRNGVNISTESSKNYKVPQRLYEWSLEAERDGDLESKASHEQMYNTVIGFLDEMMVLTDTETLTLDEMIALLEEAPKMFITP